MSTVLYLEKLQGKSLLVAKQRMVEVQSNANLRANKGEDLCISELRKKDGSAEPRPGDGGHVTRVAYLQNPKNWMQNPLNWQEHSATCFDDATFQLPSKAEHRMA